MSFNVLSLFDGIGCARVALDRANISVNNYYASEIDKYAIKVSKSNYPDIIQIGDVKEIKADSLPEIDLLIGGSPCQGFSWSGFQLNFDDPRSKLFFEFVRLVKQIKPRYWLLENVKMKKEYIDIISGYLKTIPIEINSALVSAQKRKRMYWANFDMSLPGDKNIMLSDMVGQYDGIYVKPRGKNRRELYDYKGKAPTMTSSSWDDNFFIVTGDTKRKFTVEEAETLQTLPIGYTRVVSNTQRFRLLGNAFTVDVIAHILKCLP